MLNMKVLNVKNTFDSKWPTFQTSVAKIIISLVEILNDALQIAHSVVSFLYSYICLQKSIIIKKNSDILLPRGQDKWPSKIGHFFN